jgi:chromosome segregation ATPase
MHSIEVFCFGREIRKILFFSYLGNVMFYSMTEQDKIDIIQGILTAQIFEEMRGDIKYLKKEVSYHTEQFELVFNKLNDHSKKFQIIFEKLDDHTKKLDDHTKKLDDHTKKLDDHTKKLGNHNKKLNSHTEQFKAIFEKLDDNQYYIDLNSREISKILEEVLEIKSNINRFEIRQGQQDRILEKHLDDILQIKTKLKMA